MPRIKTSRSAAKRFKLTGGGSIRRSRAYGNHILTKKTSKRKRTLRKSTLVHATEDQRIRRLLAT